MNIIKMENVSKIYSSGENEVRALDNVNLSINKGEFVAVVGASGSGKSTLMNIMGCLDFPDRGRYMLCGEDVLTMRSSDLTALRSRSVGFVFQRFCLIPDLTALENVMLPLRYKHIDRAKRRDLAQSALDTVGLGARATHFPRELSGGQQQRVAIARALVSSPKLILADEPTGNLDSESGALITGLINDLHRQGNTVVMITHDMALANMAERQIRIKDGKIV